jgi:hypothetical protein
VYVELIMPPLTPTISIAHAKAINIVPFLLITQPLKRPVQKLLSQWSLPLPYCPRIATIQGAGVAFPGARISFGALTEKCGKPE